MGIRAAQALDSFRSNDLIGIGMEADAVRRRLHPEGVVTYSVRATVLWTGDCGSMCEQAADAAARGATGLCMTGTGGIELNELITAGEALRRRVPEVTIEAPGPDELQGMAQRSGFALPEVVRRLVGAGFDSVDRAGPVLDASGPASLRTGLETWVEVHRAAHNAGIRTVAAMTYGAGESAEERVAFLSEVERMQQETGGFLAFAPEPAGLGLLGPTAVESLKMVAIGRMMIETIASVEAPQAQGLKVLEVSMRFGANDAGPLNLGESGRPDLGEEDLRRVIRDAGFAPVARHHSYGVFYTV